MSADRSWGMLLNETQALTVRIQRAASFGKPGIYTRIYRQEKGLPPSTSFFSYVPDGEWEL